MTPSAASDGPQRPTLRSSVRLSCCDAIAAERFSQSTQERVACHEPTQQIGKIWEDSAGRVCCAATELRKRAVVVDANGRA